MQGFLPYGSDSSIASFSIVAHIVCNAQGCSNNHMCSETYPLAIITATAAKSCGGTCTSASAQDDADTPVEGEQADDGDILMMRRIVVVPLTVPSLPSQCRVCLLADWIGRRLADSECTRLRSKSFLLPRGTTIFLPKTWVISTDSAESDEAESL